MQDYPRCPRRGLFFLCVMNGQGEGGTRLHHPGTDREKVRSRNPADLNWWESLFCCKKKKEKEAVFLLLFEITDRLADTFNCFHSSLSVPFLSIPLTFSSSQLPFFDFFFSFPDCFLVCLLNVQRSWTPLVTHFFSVPLRCSPCATSDAALNFSKSLITFGSENDSFSSLIEPKYSVHPHSPNFFVAIYFHSDLIHIMICGCQYYYYQSISAHLTFSSSFNEVIRLWPKL